MTKSATATDGGFRTDTEAKHRSGPPTPKERQDANTPIGDLMDALISYTAPLVFNPWLERDLRDLSPLFYKTRRRSLMRHFDCDARYLLVGEAPGYQGCHFSGVPFTSERLISQDKIPRVFNVYKGHVRPLFNEPSATVVWRTLYDLHIEQETVLWNAFPWHPFKSGRIMSNRGPTSKELDAGAEAMKLVRAAFPDAHVIAIGMKAKELLRRTSIIPYACVRHPSMGGARKFAEHMRNVVAYDEEV